MSEELKNRVLAHRVNRAGERLSKISEDESLKGMESFREQIRQLKPEFEEAQGELNEIVILKEGEVIRGVKRLNTFLFIAKVIFIVLTLVELPHIGKGGGDLGVILAITFGSLAVFFWFLGSIVTSYSEKIEAFETMIEIDELEDKGRVSDIKR